MNSVPPNPVFLPVLTERLEPEDAVIEEDIVEPPFAVQPSAYAQAVYRGPELAQSAEVPLLEAPTIDLDELWLRIAPGLQQQLLELVYAKLDAMAPQLAARLFDTLKPTLHASLAEALKQA